MKKLIFLFLVALTLSCQDDTEPVTPTNPPTEENPGATYETQDVQIQLPQGSTFSWEGAELISFGESFPINNEGKTKTISTPEEGNLSYVFDKENNLILMGFLSKSKSQISPQSTADVLLYLATTLWITPEDFTSDFYSKIDQIPAAVSWRETFEGLWKADPLLLSKGAYAIPLQDVLKKIMPKPNELDIRSKVSDIQVDEGDVKSGIQVFESDLGKISINNFYRRRAHGFAYKMSTKMEDGTTKTLISNIGSGTAASKDFAISATSPASSLTGAIGGIIETGGEGFTKSTIESPFDLSLADNEIEATFKVRVVGPGNNAAGAFMTDLEKIKQQKITVETFVIDFIYPAISVMFSWKDELKGKGIDISDPATAQFIEEYSTLIKTVPGVYEKLNEGKYKEALQAFLLVVYDDVLKGALGDLLKSPYEFMAKRYNIKPNKIPAELKDFNTSKLEKMAKIIKVVDTVLGFSDILLVSIHSSISNQVDEWTVTARSAKVSLIPAEATVSSRGNKEIKAEIKNLEEEGGDNFPYFKWSTSGKYGYIQDSKGNKGKSFDSSDKEIIYYSETSASDLPEENNFEYVYVEAYYKNQLIGRDTTVLNLKKSSYMLKPGGLVLSGKEELISSAKLYIEPVNERDADFTGKKVVWSTEGKHGRLVNFAENSTVITTYDTNSIRYLCTDEDTEKGTETVKARIYEKSAVDGEYFLYEELTLEIEIDNSDNIKIITVDLSLTSFENNTDKYYTCGSRLQFLVEPEPNAISYTATIIDLTPGGNFLGNTTSWNANKTPEEDGKYRAFMVAYKTQSRPVNLGPPPCGAIAAEVASKFVGKAQVVIRLKDPG